MSENDNDIDNDIFRYLRDHGYTRENMLVDEIFNGYETQRNEGKQVGCSKITIRRHIRDLVKNNRISKIEYSEFDVHGINDKSKKAVYYCILTPPEMREHFDVVIDLLRSDNPIHKKHGLKELKRYDSQYLLNPRQLGDLTRSLDSSDLTLIDPIIDLLSNYIIDKRREPREQKEFISRLTALLKKKNKDLENFSLLRRRILKLLAHYNRDSVIINQIKQDATSLESIQKHLEDYKDSYNQSIIIAPIIERNNTELLHFEITLEEKGQLEIAAVISEIRDESHKLLNPTIANPALKTTDNTANTPKLPRIKSFGRKS